MITKKTFILIILSIVLRISSDSYAGAAKTISAKTYNPPSVKSNFNYYNSSKTSTTNTRSTNTGSTNYYSNPSEDPNSKLADLLDDSPGCRSQTSGVCEDDNGKNIPVVNIEIESTKSAVKTKSNSFHSMNMPTSNIKKNITDIQAKLDAANTMISSLKNNSSNSCTIKKFFKHSWVFRRSRVFSFYFYSF